jgi:CRP-like cAMP-binding protein
MVTSGLSCQSERSKLLRALPHIQQAQLAAEVETVPLTANQVLAVPGEPIRYVYFPRDSVVSLLVPMEDGTRAEGATIGNEGLVGLQVFLSDGVGPEEMVVQVPI